MSGATTYREGTCVWVWEAPTAIKNAVSRNIFFFRFVREVPPTRVIWWTRKLNADAYSLQAHLPLSENYKGE